MRGYLHVRCDIPGADTIHLYIMLAPLVTERLGDLPESPFRCGIRGNRQTTLKSQQRAEIDDFAPTEWNHMSPGSLAEQPY